MCATAETARLGFPQGVTSLLTSTGNCGGYTSKSGKVTGTHGQQARNSTTRKRNPGNTWENLQFQEARGARCGPRVAGLPCSPRQPCGDSPASPEHPDGPRMLLVALGTGSVVSPCPGQQRHCLMFIPFVFVHRALPGCFGLKLPNKYKCHSVPSKKLEIKPVQSPSEKPPACCRAAPASAATPRVSPGPPRYITGLVAVPTAARDSLP